jgi:DNA-binding transcriptional MerR regulator
MSTVPVAAAPTQALPPIPAKRYFTIGEVSELCAVKPHVLRYWEQEFTQLRPMKRRGNRRYYQHHEVLLVRRIRELLYDEGFTISGARNRLGDQPGASASAARSRDEKAAQSGDEQVAVTMQELLAIRSELTECLALLS